MSFGQRLKQLRRERNWTQEDLGKKINTHLQTVVRYENDTVIPTATVLKKMSEAFGVSIDYLVFGPTDGTSLHLQNKELLKRIEKLDKIKPETIEPLLQVMDVYIRENATKELLAAS